MNKHTISLSRFCQVLDDGIRHKVLRIPTPSFIYIRAYNRLIHDFKSMFDTTDTDLLFENRIMLHDIYNEAYNVIPIMLSLLSCGYPDEKVFYYIRDNYGVHDKSITEIIEFLKNEQERLINRYEEIKKLQNNSDESESKHSFSDIIASVEDNLDVSIDRKNTSLYMFASQYRRSVEKIKYLEKNKANGSS